MKATSCLFVLAALLASAGSGAADDATPAVAALRDELRRIASSGAEPWHRAAVFEAALHETSPAGIDIAREAVHGDDRHLRAAACSFLVTQDDAALGAELRDCMFEPFLRWDAAAAIWRRLRQAELDEGLAAELLERARAHDELSQLAVFAGGTGDRAVTAGLVEMSRSASSRVAHSALAGLVLVDPEAALEATLSAWDAASRRPPEVLRGAGRGGQELVKADWSAIAIATAGEVDATTLSDAGRERLTEIIVRAFPSVLPQHAFDCGNSYGCPAEYHPVFSVIGRFGRHALPALHRLASSPDPLRRRNALFALSDFEDPRRGALFRDGVRDPDPRVRLLATPLLEQELGSAAIPFLVPLLQDPDERVRLRAALALAPMGRAEALPVLAEFVDRDPRVPRGEPKEGAFESLTLLHSPLQAIESQTGRILPACARPQERPFADPPATRACARDWRAWLKSVEGTSFDPVEIERSRMDQALSEAQVEGASGSGPRFSAFILGASGSASDCDALWASRRVEKVAWLEPGLLQCARRGLGPDVEALAADASASGEDRALAARLLEGLRRVHRPGCMTWTPEPTRNFANTKPRSELAPWDSSSAQQVEWDLTARSSLPASQRQARDASIARALRRSTPAGIAALLLAGEPVQRRAAAVLMHGVATTGSPLDLFLGGMRLGMTRDDLRRPFGVACLREAAPRATSAAEREALDAALAAIAAMPQDGVRPER